MSSRLRRVGLAVAATALAAPALTSCGFDMATDRVYTPGAGPNNRDAKVDVLSAVIVSSQANEGTLMASFVNNYPDRAASVTGIAGDVQTADEVAIDIPEQGIINLAAEGAPEIKVTGEFEAGDFVNVQFTVADGELVEFQIPVVTNSGYWANLDGPAPADETPHFEGPLGEEH